LVKKKTKVLSKEYWTNLLSSFLQSNKFVEKTLPQLYQELGEVIYSDAKEEITEVFEAKIAEKQEEIERLKLLAEKNTTDRKIDQQTQEIVSIVAEPQTTCSTKNDVKQIIEQYLKYKEKGKKLLEDEARKRGINVKSQKGKGTVEEIIILLMTTPESKINFNE
jgi:hypothetical protein